MYPISDETKKKYGDPYSFTHPVNPNSGQRTQTRSVWGFGGWYSNTIDAALRHDDADAFIEVMRAAEMSADDKTFDGLTMDQYCEKRLAPKCRAAIKTLRDQKEIRELSKVRRES